MKSYSLLSYLVMGIISLTSANLINAGENQGVIRIIDNSSSTAGVVKIQNLNTPVIRGQSPGCGDTCCPTSDGCGDNGKSCCPTSDGCGSDSCGTDGCGTNGCSDKSCGCGKGQCGTNGCGCSKNGKNGCNNPNCGCRRNGGMSRHEMRRADRMDEYNDWASNHGLPYCDEYGSGGGLRGWYHCQSEMFLARNRATSMACHDWMCCKFGYFIPTGGCGKGLPPFGCYSMVYAVDPQYADPRDGQLYASQKYGVPVSVPLAPNVHYQYNYSWGVPASRLTPISNVAY